MTLLDRMASHDALRARVGSGSVVGTLPGAGQAGEADAGTAHRGDAPRGYDTAVWAAMADQGWLALEVPEDEGGLGMGLVEIAVLCEEIGRRLAAVPFLSVRGGAGRTERTRGAGRRRSTKEWREASRARAKPWPASPSGRAPASPPQPADDDGACVLSGPTPPTAFAPSADLAVIVTDDDVFAVDQREAPRPDPLSAMDRTRELGILRFDRHPGPASRRTRRRRRRLSTGRPPWSARRCSGRPTGCSP